MYKIKIEIINFLLFGRYCSDRFENYKFYILFPNNRAEMWLR